MKFITYLDNSGIYTCIYKSLGYDWISLDKYIFKPSYLPVSMKRSIPLVMWHRARPFSILRMKRCLQLAQADVAPGAKGSLVTGILK